MSKRISLWGEWNFGLGDICAYDKLKNKIIIPGTLQEQGYGNKIVKTTPWVSSLHDKLWYEREEHKNNEEIQTPFLPQPRTHYLGKASYGKEFFLEEEGYYSLFIEIVRWTTRVFVDGKEAGEVTSLCTPHIYSLGFLNKGIHNLVIEVDNEHRYPYRPDGHMVSDSLGATFHGMAGEVSLLFHNNIQIRNSKIETHLHNKTIEYSCILCNLEQEDWDGEIKCLGGSTISYKKDISLSFGEHEFHCSFAYPMDTPLWDEFHPHLETLTVELMNKSKVEVDKVEITFGFRKIEVAVDKFLFNGREVFFRGTHSGGDFPLTGYPSYEEKDWYRIFSICKEWGLNYMRFHSFTPPKAAFIAADKIGFYLQVECGMWNEFNKGIEMNDILWEETKRILDTFGNHPSFVMLSPSNEPGGNWFEPLTLWVEKAKKYDKRRLYTAQSGWFYPMEPGDIYGTDYVYFHRSGYGLTPGGTIRSEAGWHGKDYYESIEHIKYPVISHELAQWTSYPKFDVIEKFKGYLTPSTYCSFRDHARKKGVLKYNQEFAFNSGRRKVQLLKEDIEATMRTPSIYGFELLDLHDYLGQGGAFVGVLDAFWEEKGFIKSKEFRQFCQGTVPLIRLDKRIYTREETIVAPIEISHFGEKSFDHVRITWNVKEYSDEDPRIGPSIIEGVYEMDSLPIGKNISIGKIEISLDNFTPKKEYIITVELEDIEGINNTWNFFVMDSHEETLSSIKGEEKIIVSHSLMETIHFLRQGNKVIFQPKKEEHRYDSVPLNSKTVFWNGQMGPRYVRGMGICCDKNHLSLKEFPTREFSDWQWSEIIDSAYGLNLSYLPSSLEPIVRAIDDWNRNYPLGMLLECNIGTGKLFIVTCDITNNLDNRICARQLRNSIVQYVASKEFSPSVTLSEDELKHGFFPRYMIKDYGVSTINELSSIMDGRVSHGFIKDHAYPYIMPIHINTSKTNKIKGFLFVPRQNDREHRGDPKGYKVYGKVNERMVELIQGELPSSYEVKEVIWEKAIETSYLEIHFLYGYFGTNITSYVQKKEGWFKECKDYVDTTLAIGQITLLWEENEFRNYKDDSYKMGCEQNYFDRIGETKKWKMESIEMERSTTVEIEE